MRPGRLAPAERRADRALGDREDPEEVGRARSEAAERVRGRVRSRNRGERVADAVGRLVDRVAELVRGVVVPVERHYGRGHAVKVRFVGAAGTFGVKMYAVPAEMASICVLLAVV